MKHHKLLRRMVSLVLLMTTFLVGCGAPAATPAPTPTPGAAVLSLDLTDEVTISNEDFSLTVFEIAEISEKNLGDRRVTVKADAQETLALYEIRMRYTNYTEEEAALSYKKLLITLPEVEDSANVVRPLGWCEQGVDDPPGEMSRCAYIPAPPKPGVYGPTGVILLNTFRPQPGEQANLYLYVILEKTLSNLEISFVQPD